MIRRILVSLAAVACCAMLAVPALAATKVVSVKDDFFARKSLTISKGSTVRWVWRGSGRHNVVVDSGPSDFHSSIQRHGSYSHRFTRKGRYHIICTVHANMAMTVHVS